MVIKRVVLNKPVVKEVVKKFPEFDNSKIYVIASSGFKRDFRRHNGGFATFETGTSVINCTYTSLKHFIDTNPDYTLYILDDIQEYERFLTGDRNFPTVQEIEEVVEVPAELAEDEVSVDDAVPNKIYAYNNGYALYKLQIYYTGNSKDVYAFFNIDTSAGVGIGGTHYKSVSSVLTSAINAGREVYQFDTQEEFLKWSLEQVTGKKVRLGGADVIELKTGLSIDEEALDEVIDFYVEENAEGQQGCSCSSIDYTVPPSLCMGVSCHTYKCRTICKKALKAKILGTK